MLSQDQLRGVIYGQAVGDALGLGTEFLSKSEVDEYYPQGLHRYAHIVQDGHRSRWVRGDWTDDTDQMLCIFDSLLERQRLDIQDIARRIYQWATHGGMGIGMTVLSVLQAPQFLRDPHAAARLVWEDSGRCVAANGAVMRTAILGVWHYDQPERVMWQAEQVCKITHYDPRCVASCVAVSCLISAFLQGQSDTNALIAEALDKAALYDPLAKEYVDATIDEPLEALDLDEGLNPGETNRIGYTLKALGAGLWALRHATSFADGITQVIHEGGDADTNAAVVGALLGAKFGFVGIQMNGFLSLHMVTSWSNGLHDRWHCCEYIHLH